MGLSIRKNRIKSAKSYFYDVSKLLLATLVIGSFAASEKFNPPVFIAGFGGTIICYLIAYFLEGKES